MLKQIGSTKVQQDTDLEERIEKTENNNLPVSIYMMLASDENEDVRYSLASNANIPIQVLHLLEEDENVYVSCRATQTLERIEKEAVKANLSIIHYGSGAIKSAEGLGLASA